MPAGDPYHPVPHEPSTDDARAAFRALHGRHLHGFALLLTLGDASQVARLTDAALVAGARELDALRHPERAGAWLRRRVFTELREGGRGAVESTDLPLADLGAGPAVMAGLTALDRRARAAIIAAEIERFDARDVATIVGRSGGALDRLLRAARSRYLAARAADPAEPASIEGGLVDRIRDVARRTMA
jgi:DNA-directed RNA polymerase specialized sigma24 family protein